MLLGVEKDQVLDRRCAVKDQEIKGMCENLRKRRTEKNQTVSAIFFRSKMSQPLSPKTPSLLIDLVVSRDENTVERSIHTSLYDMSYRYDCNSSWVQKLSDLIPGRSTEDLSENSSDDNLTFNNVSDTNHCSRNLFVRFHK